MTAATQQASAATTDSPTPLENALFARLEPNGQISFIYCDQQCHPLDAGATLLDNYRSEEAVADLLAMGSIRKLEPDARDCVSYASLMERPPESPQHFDGSPREFFNHFCNRVTNVYLYVPQQGWTVTSGREPIPLADAVAWHQAP